MTDFDPETRRRFAAIQANWDARTPIHVASRFYDVGRKEPASWFAGYEWADLGDLTGRDVLHLQCHLGTETAAFAERGARRVVGLDISGTAVAEARRLATAPIEYVRANVYDAPTALDGDRFDVVYTGKGALCYLPDLPRWAGVVAELLRPGGLLYLVEFHPLLVSLGLVPSGPDLLLRHDYLEGRGAQLRDGTYTYTDGPALTESTEVYEWAHGLGEVVSVLAGAGFRITSLRESDELPWPRWPGMVPTGTGFWRLPDDAPRIPLFYALAASRP
ncbi:class I SAM-dependent methyltransferase [Actinoplanes sp. NPDC051411]|uniref:class I SAM-dependent methyltransferase n=1 Tax=Actinoplanes sp. NPDC051411 TaxID=3155522 RepID=UPI0034127BF8